MSWDEFVRENEGPGLDEARRRLRDDNDGWCVGCGAPAGYPPAGPCNDHGTAVAAASDEVQSQPENDR